MAFALSGLGGGCVAQTESESDPEDPEGQTFDFYDGDGESDGDGGSDDAVPRAGSGPEGDEPDDDPAEPHTGSDFSCCQSHAGAGCESPTVESCVCGMDPECCTASWDATCVMTARAWCGSC